MDSAVIPLFLELPSSPIYLEPDSDAGFTLPELLVTILIIGLLSGIAIVTLGNSRQGALTSSCKSGYATLQLAISSYQADTATVVGYPVVPTVQDLIPSYMNEGLLFGSSFVFDIETSTSTSDSGGYQVLVSKIESGSYLVRGTTNKTNTLVVDSQTAVINLLGKQIFGSGIRTYKPDTGAIESTTVSANAISPSTSLTMSRAATGSYQNSLVLIGGTLLGKAPQACESLT